MSFSINFLSLAPAAGGVCVPDEIHFVHAVLHSQVLELRRGGIASCLGLCDLRTNPFDLRGAELEVGVELS